MTILAELQHLRAEVRSVGKLTEEVTVLRQEVATLRQELSKLEQLKSAVTDVRKDIVKIMEDRENFPPLNAAERGCAGTQLTDLASASVVSAREVIPTDSVMQSGERNQVGARQFSAHAQDLRRTGLVHTVARSHRRKPVIGASHQNNHLKSVQTLKTGDVYISRLHPETKEAEIVDCINEVKDDLKVHNVACNRLQSRYEELYCSMHAAVQVDASDFSKAINLFMSAEAWPVGVFVRRYFKPKDGQHN